MSRTNSKRSTKRKTSRHTASPKASAVNPPITQFSILADVLVRVNELAVQLGWITQAIVRIESGLKGQPVKPPGLTYNWPGTPGDPNGWARAVMNRGEVSG